MVDSGGTGGFSTNDQLVFEREINSQTDELKINNEDDLRSVFELDRCVKWIKDNHLSSVSLQFPDSLLQFAPQVASNIQNHLGADKRVSILGDTSYGECCVDEVAAEHVGADSIIHFGHTCLTPTQRLPVLQVFTVLKVEPSDLVDKIQSELRPPEDQRVLVFYDVQYHRRLQEMMDPPTCVSLCPPPVDGGPTEDGGLKCGRVVFPGPDPWAIVYVGNNDRYETMLRLSFPDCSKIYNYVPCKRMLLSSGPSISRQLMKRYALVEKAKDADRIGILVGTLGAANYADMIDRVRATITKSGRRAYTFLVGKPNVAKLANFPEIDVFVLVACPENCVSGSIFDSVDFFKPVISPYELDIALNKNREWGEWGNSHGYQTDFRCLLPGSVFHKDFVPDTEADVSLVTGKIRAARGDCDSEQNGHEDKFALVAQETQISELHRNGGGEFLSQKSWQGLEQKLGQTPVTKAVQGRTGIPMEYKQLE